MLCDSANSDSSCCGWDVTLSPPFLKSSTRQVPPVIPARPDLTMGSAASAKRWSRPTAPPFDLDLYEVQLQRCDRDIWDMHMAVHPHIDGMVLTEFGASQAVREWNEGHPELEIHRGHVIKEINGYKDHASMKEQLSTSTSLRLLMCKVRTGSQQWAFEVQKHRERRRVAIDALVHQVEVQEGDLGPCAICHDEMVQRCDGGHDRCDALTPVRLPCNHHFHESCVKRCLLTGKHRCPLCNHDFEMVLRHESSTPLLCQG